MQNDFRQLLAASQDTHDDGLNNGSQGVAFDASHDDGGAFLSNVANAYLLLRPGNANVYFNAEEFGTGRDFPKDGRGDALGGLYGEAITTLVDLRNTHGRGDFVPRLVEKESLVYERANSALIVLSNRTDAGSDGRTVQTAFAPGTRLVELTGNAAGDDDIPEMIEVGPGGVANLRVRRNGDHGNGYLVYGLATPKGTLTLDGTSGVLPGQNPTAATNGTARLADLAVVTGDEFTVRLQTNEVRLLGTFRDPDADGDNALLRVNGGLDVNGNGRVDHVAPGSVAYGFEQFADKRSPLTDGGDGEYVQAVDTTNLPEGVNFVQARAFRRRTDGGPAVFTDWREAIYVDRLPPETAAAGTNFLPGRPDDLRQFLVRSTDKTAENVHVFLDLPADVSDAEILAQISSRNRAGQIDRDLFAFGFGDLKDGNHVLTAVAFEPTGNLSVTRFPGIAITGAGGAGLGDLNGDGTLARNDVFGPGAFEQVLYSQDAQFNPAADLDADGRVTNLDLYALPDLAGGSFGDEARAAILRRGNVDGLGGTGAADIDFLYQNLGSTAWLLDLDADGGPADAGDVETLVRTILRSEFGDANLDGSVSIADFAVLRGHFGTAGGWAAGDFTGDGVVSIADFAVLRANFGASVSTAQLAAADAWAAGVGLAAVPEPGAALTVLGAIALPLTRRRRRGVTID